MTAEAKLTGLRVLLMAHNLRHDYLSSFLGHAQRRQDWKLAVISDRPYPAFCAGLTVSPDDFFLMANETEEASWEREVGEVNRVRSLVSECERVNRLPIQRIVLTDERITGRGYGREFYYWPGTRASRASMCDNAVPERVALRRFAWCAGVLDAFAPDLIIVGGQSTPFSITMVMLGTHRGVPFLMSRPSKILSNRCYWTMDFRMLNTEAQTRCKQKIDRRERPGEEAWSHLAQFRKTPTTVAYIRRNWEVAAGKNLRSAVSDITKRTKSRVRWLLQGRQGKSGKPVLSKIWDTFRSRIVAARQGGLFNTYSESQLREMRYLFIALHKEPELAINFQAPLWHNQKNLVAWLSINLPAGYRLLIRDHRKNKGKRPMLFYRDIQRYPGVELVSPYDWQFKYIQNAAVILADNGSTGWEGLIFRKRVITLAQNFYEAARLADTVLDPSQIGNLIIRCLNEKGPVDMSEWDRRLACLIEAEIETTVVEDETSHDDSLKIIQSLLEKAKLPSNQEAVLADLAR